MNNQATVSVLRELALVGMANAFGRMATVEPVFGSLVNYYGMKRSNAKGKQAAHKFMLMSATTYNLQKLISGFTDPKSNVKSLLYSKLLPFNLLSYILYKSQGELI